MKLHYSSTSPYSKKVRMVALELGLSIDQVIARPMAWDTGYGAINPINRVPTLELADGQFLFDSPVICEYLNVVSGGSLLPASGDARWAALRLQALGDGLMDSATPLRQEESREAEQQSAERIRLYRRSMTQVLDHLEANVQILLSCTVGTISITSALEYLDFRFATEQWQLERPKLAQWHAEMSARPSSVATRLQ